MPSIAACPLPTDALLLRYQRDGGFVDCYTTTLPARIDHADYVAAFYTSWLFRLERLVLKFVARRPSTDQEAIALGEGSSDRFAAWVVEDRSTNQLLLCDYAGSTRSWLMVEVVGDQDSANTRLYFGSAVVPRKDPSSGTSSMSSLFHLLLGFHRLCSRLLLGAARGRLLRSRR